MNETAERAVLVKGMPVIINDFDAPQSRMVAVLTGFDAQKGIWFARYLSRFTNMARCAGEQKYVTALSDFGVRLEVNDSFYRCVVVGPSIATYCDGIERKWQDWGVESDWREIRLGARKYLNQALLSKETEHA